MLSGSRVALPDVASARGVIGWRGVREPHADLALPPDASAGDAVTCSQPRVAGRGVRAWGLPPRVFTMSLQSLADIMRTATGDLPV